jgi:copper chaperone CopZ
VYLAVDAADTPVVYRNERRQRIFTMAPLTASPEAATYRVVGMTCDHCTAAVTDEVAKLDGVASVDVDLDTKLVRVHGGDVDAAAVIAAIDEAGYDAVAA